MPGSAANTDASLSARTAADTVPDGPHAVAGPSASADTAGRPPSVAPALPSPRIPCSNTGSAGHIDGKSGTRHYSGGTDGRRGPRSGSDRRTGLLRRPVRSRTLSVRPVSYGDTLEGSERLTPGPRSFPGAAASRSTPPRVATSRNPPRSPARDQLAHPRSATIVSSDTVSTGSRWPAERRHA